jgi:hypothetical protein
MSHVFSGTVKGSVIVLDDNLQLPEGTAVEVHVEKPHVIETGDPDRDAVYHALLKRRAAYAGQRVNMAEILEEEKQDREARVDEWLSPKP